MRRDPIDPANKYYSEGIERVYHTDDDIVGDLELDNQLLSVPYQSIPVVVGMAGVVMKSIKDDEGI